MLPLALPVPAFIPIDPVEPFDDDGWDIPHDIVYRNTVHSFKPTAQHNRVITVYPKPSQLVRRVVTFEAEPITDPFGYIVEPQPKSGSLIIRRHQPTAETIAHKRQRDIKPGSRVSGPTAINGKLNPGMRHFPALAYAARSSGSVIDMAHILEMSRAFRYWPTPRKLGRDDHGY